MEKPYRNNNFGGAPAGFAASSGKYIGIVITKKGVALLAGAILASNVLTYALVAPSRSAAPAELSANMAATALPDITTPGLPSPPRKRIYLADKAAVYVSDIDQFEDKVKRISNQLEIPPEWLMAVIYAESKFNPEIENQRGSGAVGLIQFMPETAADLNTSAAALRRMDAAQQLDYVSAYLKRVRATYGNFKSLTDLYLAVLFPKAIGQDYCFALYAKPSQTYQRNTILDENKDGSVTVSDIDRRMRRIYPTAFTARLGAEGED